jgi:hypothetical protein
MVFKLIKRFNLLYLKPKCKIKGRSDGDGMPVRGKDG